LEKRACLKKIISTDWRKPWVSEFEVKEENLSGMSVLKKIYDRELILLP
jgi:hypothetical protein